MPDLHAMPGLWTPVKGYDRLLKRLRPIGCATATRVDDPATRRTGNLLPVAYDWRLSNRYNGERLATIVEPALARWRAQGGPYADATRRVRLPLHGWPGRPLVHRTVRRRRHHPQARSLLGTPYRGAPRPSIQLVNGVRHGSARSAST